MSNHPSHPPHDTAVVQGLLAEASKLLQSGAVQQAFDAAAKAKSFRVPTINLDLIRGACLVNMGRFQDAVQSLREELCLFPNNQEAKRLLDYLEVEVIPYSRPSTINDPDFIQVLEIIRPYTMLSTERLHNLFNQARRLCLENIQGNFVECGVAGGGSSALLAYVIRRYSRSPRLLWSFDSFCGMPTPSAEDHHDGIAADDTGWGTGTCAAPLRSLEEVSRKLGISDLIRPVEGFFDSTLPAMRNWVGSIALLHMDADWHSSTKSILDNLYGQLADRAVIQVDDYGYWAGCRKACDDFFATRAVRPVLRQIDETGVWLEKPDQFPLNPILSPESVSGFRLCDITQFGVESQMSENERFQLYWLLASELTPSKQRREISFVEVGSYAGASLLQSYISLKSHGLPMRLCAVEPSGQAQFYQVLRELGPEVRHLKMFSDVAAPLIAEEYRREGRIADAIFIDGDHSYEGVKRDLELYYPLLAAGGLLIVHDYLPPLTGENRDYILFHHGNKEPGIRQACDEFFSSAEADPIELPLLKPTDPTQTQSWLPIIPDVFSTVRAWRKR